MLIVNNLTKTFQSGDKTLSILKGVSFFVEAGQTCAIVGPSGSGKTTLLGLCAGLDNPSTGSVLLDGTSLHDLGEEDRAAFRLKNIGFVFQTFRLIPTLTALENVMVPLDLQGDPTAKEKAQETLVQVGLEARAHHYPLQLSGGEQQRVALARAFLNTPKILFADEPTGNLDDQNQALVIDLLFKLNRSNKTTLVLVTHNLEFAQKTDRVFQLKNGQLN